MRSAIRWLFLVGVLLMTSAILEISDGTTTINLFSESGRLGVRSWKTVLPAPKSGGGWADNPSIEGRQLSSAVDGNGSEEIVLGVRGSTQDETISSLQDLVRLLDKGRSYWTSRYQNEPVWLRTRKHNETEESYLAIRDYAIPEIGAPYPDGETVVLGPIPDHLTLTVEHLYWLSDRPGTGRCAQLSATGDFQTANLSWSGTPGQSTDDVLAPFPYTGLFATGLVRHTLGYDAPLGGRVHGGIRFPAVNVPAGATILSAYVRFRASADCPDDNVRVLIAGEKVADAATFSTGADFFVRLGTRQTAAKVPWPMIDDGMVSIPPWTSGSDYDTPDLSTVIQELIDQSGWAAGNDLVLFFIDNGSDINRWRTAASWDDPALPAPTLYIVYQTTRTTFGRAATCNEEEVFVSNKHTRANITHIFRYDASLAAYSANLVAAFPYDLLPNPVQNGDMVYFIIDTSLDDSGPFDSLIFDLSPAAVYAGPTVQGIWEHWTGAAWVARSVEDNTDGGSGPLSRSGVHGIHFSPGSNWATTAINGVTGYIIRLRISIGGGDSVTTPTQVNRDVYTVTWNGVRLAAGQALGDVPALAHWRIKNSADNAGTGTGTVVTSCAGFANRVILALRSLSKGADFVPYLNWVDEQNPPGISVTAGGAAIASRTYPPAPCGRNYYWTPAAATALADIGAIIEFGADIAPQYFGSFRVFVILTAGGSAGDFTGRLQLRMGSPLYPTTIWSSNVVTLPASGIALVDFGNLSFSDTLTPSDLAQGMTMHLQLGTTALVPDDVHFYALALMPTDEWIADLSDNDAPLGWLGAQNGGNYPTQHRYLDVDSISVPKRPTRTPIYDEEHDYLVTPGWKMAPAGPAWVQANADQMLWVLSGQYDYTNSRYTYDPHICHSVQLWVVNRYKTFRGSR